MTELEKLAKEYRHSWIYGNVMEPMGDLEMDEAYKAGFRRAREMICELSDDYTYEQLGER